MDAEAEAPRSAPADGLELHWSFEARNGTTIYDLSGNGRNGTLSGGSFVSSPWGDAVSLDGVDDYISFVGPRNPTDFGGAYDGAFTISARVKVDDADRYNTLCWGCAPNTLLSVGTSNVGARLYGTIWKPSNNDKTNPTSDNGSIADNTWTMVTMVVEAGVGTKYYIDCLHNETVSESDSGLKDYGYSRVGEGFNPSSYYDGEIDDLKVWSRALSQTEIAGLCPCDADPLGVTLGIEPPRAPQPYTAPVDNNSTIEEVSTTADLQAKVAADTPIIVLADGVYEPGDLTPLDYLKIEGQQIWAKHSGKAILKFGIETGNSSGTTYDGAELHGLAFDIEDDDYLVPLPQGPTVISNWGVATNLLIEDCVIHGNGAADFGILVDETAAEDFEARRLEIDGTIDTGIIIGAGDDTLWPVVLEDVRVWDINDPTGAPIGIGIHLLEPADLSRVHVRDVRWAAVVANGDSTGSNLVDIDVDQFGTDQSTGRVGVYLDNTAEDVTLSQFCVGPNSQDGVRSEWDNGEFPYGVDNVVQNGLIESQRMGVSFDTGTENGTISNVTFRNYSFAAIMFHDNVASGDWPNYGTPGTQTGNTFEECGVCSVTHGHPNDMNPGCAVNGASCP